MQVMLKANEPCKLTGGMIFIIKIALSISKHNTFLHLICILPLKYKRFDCYKHVLYF